MLSNLFALACELSIGRSLQVTTSSNSMLCRSPDRSIICISRTPSMYTASWVSCSNSLLLRLKKVVVTLSEIFAQWYSIPNHRNSTLPQLWASSSRVSSGDELLLHIIDGWWWSVFRELRYPMLFNWTINGAIQVHQTIAEESFVPSRFWLLVIMQKNESID